MPKILCPYNNSIINCQNQVNKFCYDCKIAVCNECHILPGHTSVDIYMSKCYKLGHYAKYYCMQCHKTYCALCISVHVDYEHKIVRI